MKLVQVIIFGGIFLENELAQKLKMINLGIRPSYDAIRFMKIVYDLGCSRYTGHVKDDKFQHFV